MNVLDLFSGIGGFSLGLERAGMRTVAFCEIEPFCRAVLRKHWPKVPIYEDVRSLTAERLAADGISVDVICGGFPCQDISVAGKGAGIEGERSGLWSEYARIIGELRPRYVIVENVAALLGRGLERVLGDLAALRFDAEWHCIPAAAVGAPHRRDRLWIVANSNHSGQLSDCGSWGGGGKTQAGDDSRRRGETMAHTDSNHGQRRRGALQMGRLRIEREIARHGDSGRTQWLTEPKVGRVANGVPAELDGNGNEKEHTQEAGTKGDENNNGLSGVWGDGKAGETSPRLFHARIGASLMSFLSHQGGSARWNQTQESNADLQALRQGVFANTQQETHTLQSRMPRDYWPHECGEALGQIWSQEPNVGRVAHDIKNRVDRLRSLGNAVVPQIPEIIGRAIMQTHQQEQA